MAAVAGCPDRREGGCGCAEGPSSMQRLVAYSLAADERRRDEHAFQFELSVSSLRASNGRIPIVLFCHGPLAPELAALCSRFGVMVADQGPYGERLAALSPQRSGDAMARYPVLHKQLNFAELAAAGARQVLCCDLDTIFFADVELVFDRYIGADVVAREEVYSARSMHGPDSAFIDEPLLARLAGHLGRAVVAPFNLGVVLYNQGVVARLADIMPVFLDDAWRLMTGLTMREFPNSKVAGSASHPWIADVGRRASEADRHRALPFPSNNGWILDEVAWWLALGLIPGLTHADFAAQDVAQNGEVLGTPRQRSTWALCHYYSNNLERIVDWLRQPPLLPPRVASNTPDPSNTSNTARHRRTAQPSATFER
jgi:hypothetical protein